MKKWVRFFMLLSGLCSLSVESKTSIEAISQFDASTVFSTTPANNVPTSFFQDETQTKTTLGQAGQHYVRGTPAGQALLDVLEHAPKDKVLTDADLSAFESTVDLPLDDTMRCLDAKCLHLPEQEDAHFEESASRLAALSDATQQFDTTRIFKGSPVTCREQALDYLNCCAQTGWGKEAHLAQCHDHEKQLAKAIEQKRAIYLGRYCAKYYPKPLHHQCREKKKSYCVFSSKLARLIQQEGGMQQLNLSFGSAKTPQCRGLLPAELQRIDFAKIDFNDVYADLHLNSPHIDVQLMAKSKGIS